MDDRELWLEFANAAVAIPRLAHPETLRSTFDHATFMELAKLNGD